MIDMALITLAIGAVPTVMGALVGWAFGGVFGGIAGGSAGASLGAWAVAFWVLNRR